MKVSEFEIDNWENSETGIVLAENDSWILIKSIPVDYCVDGYKLIKKSFIISEFEPEGLELLVKVLTLKNVSDLPPDSFAFSDTLGNLRWVEKTYGLFEFQDIEEAEIIYGRVHSIKENMLTIDMVLMDGSVEKAYDYQFDLDEIRVITFDSDYHHSMKLLYESSR